MSSVFTVTPFVQIHEENSGPELVKQNANVYNRYIFIGRERVSTRQAGMGHVAKCFEEGRIMA